MSENKPGDAEKWFEKATKLAPRSSEAHLWLGRAIGLQAATANPLRQPFLARRLKHTVDHAIELDPENLDARELRWQYYAMAPSVMGGGEAKARAEAAEIMKRNRYRGTLMSAGAASRSRDFATAERLLKSVVTEYPDSLTPVGSYAVLLADRGRPPSSVPGARHSSWPGCASATAPTSRCSRESTSRQAPNQPSTDQLGAPSCILPLLHESPVGPDRFPLTLTELTQHVIPFLPLIPLLSD